MMLEYLRGLWGQGWWGKIKAVSMSVYFAVFYLIMIHLFNSIWPDAAPF